MKTGSSSRNSWGMIDGHRPCYRPSRDFLVGCSQRGAVAEAQGSWSGHRYLSVCSG
jgi:hypothetical protein